MEKLETQEEITRVLKAGMAVLKAQDVDVGEAEFSIIQSYQDDQAIVVRVEDDEQGKRSINVLVNDVVVVLPKIENKLDIFND